MNRQLELALKQPQKGEFAYISDSEKTELFNKLVSFGQTATEAIEKLIKWKFL